MGESSERERLLSLIKDFDTAMLTSHTTSGQMRSRPMQIAGVDEDDGRIWFVTGVHSGKVEEFERDQRAAVVLQSSKCFVSITGQAYPVDDRKRLRTLWRRSWDAWFPAGPEGGEAQLIAVHPEIGEYWDASEVTGLRYAFATAKAILSGERIDSDTLDHGQVRL